MIKASPLVVPAGQALQQRLQLARALRPFRERWLSRSAFELDERRTVETSAELGGTIYPVFRPVQEPWFDVELVLEDDPAIELWRDTLHDFCQMLGDTGAFRAIRTWHLHMQEPGVASADRFPAAYLESPAGARVATRTLAGRGVRRLILFATHGDSPAWLDGRYVRVIAPWLASASVAILHLFDRPRWKEGKLGEPSGLGIAPEPGVATANLRVERSWWTLSEAEDGLLPVPATLLTPEGLGDFALMQMARGRACPVFLLDPNPLLAQDFALDGTAPTFERAVALLRDSSTDAFLLAVYLSSGAFTLPVARLVQESMFGINARQSHLAEVLLSGLVFVRSPQTGGSEPNERYFEFHDEARAILLGSLREADAKQMAQELEDRVSRHLEQIRMRGITLRALVPDANGHYDLPAWAQPFARFGVALLDPSGQIQAIRQRVEALRARLSPGLLSLVGQLAASTLQGKRLDPRTMTEEFWQIFLDSGLVAQDSTGQWRFLPGVETLLAEFTGEEEDTTDEEPPATESPPPTAPFRDPFLKRLEDGSFVKDATQLGPSMVWLPGGTFLMGSPEGVGESNEHPAHKVTLSHFAVGQYPVTVSEFRRFVEEDGYLTEAERGNGALVWAQENWEQSEDANWRNPHFEQTDDNPVVCISWNDAKAYCEWISKKSGQEYGLLTEAQWEYACRAGNEAKYYFGDNEKILGEYAWFSANANKRTHPVGKKKANIWKLFDLYGNMWEWCADWYASDYYKQYPSIDPKGPDSGSGRVIRGGSWYRYAHHCRSAYRYWRDPSLRLDSVGFRLSRTGPLPSYPFAIGADSIVPTLPHGNAGSGASAPQDREMAQPGSHAGAWEPEKVLPPLWLIHSEADSTQAQTIADWLKANGVEVLLKLESALLSRSNDSYTSEGGLGRGQSKSDPPAKVIRLLTEDASHYWDYWDVSSAPESRSVADELLLRIDGVALPFFLTVLRYVIDWPDWTKLDASPKAQKLLENLRRWRDGGEIKTDKFPYSLLHFNFKTFAVGTDQDNEERVFALRYQVYCLERSFLPAEDYPNGLERDDYDQYSTLIAAYSLTDLLVGALRLITPPDGKQFLFEEHCPKLFANRMIPPRSECAEISRLVISKLYRRRVGDTVFGVPSQLLDETPLPPRNFDRRRTQRGDTDRRKLQPEILFGLLRQVYQHSKRHGIHYWCMALEKSLALHLERIFYFTLEPLGEQVDYYGPVTPFILSMEHFENALSQGNPVLFGWFQEALDSTFPPLPSGNADSFTPAPPDRETLQAGSHAGAREPEKPEFIAGLRDPLHDGTEGPAMVWLSGGEFIMGQDDSSYDHEKPAHPVRVDAISIGQYPVTFEQYDQFCSATQRKPPDDRSWGRDSRPVINVNWEDALSYCKWLSQQTGEHYRLATEAEWEYACRAGSTTRYCYGDDEAHLGDYAWYSNNANSKTHPVGDKKPNAWQLYDMHGNVLEWCADWWSSDYYQQFMSKPQHPASDNEQSASGSSSVREQSASENPIGPASGSIRVVRGGSWLTVAGYCRSAFCSGKVPSSRNNYLGFRLARTGPWRSYAVTLGTASIVPTLPSGNADNLAPAPPDRETAQQVRSGFVTPTGTLEDQSQAQNVSDEVAKPAWLPLETELRKTAQELTILSLIQSDTATRSLVARFSLDCIDIVHCRKQVVENILNMPLDKLLDIALQERQTLFEKGDDIGSESIIRIVQAILPFTHKSDDADAIRLSRASGLWVLHELHASHKFIAELIMAQADRRAATYVLPINRYEFPSGEACLPFPPEYEHDLISHKFRRDFIKYLRQKFVDPNSRFEDDVSLTYWIRDGLRRAAKQRARKFLPAHCSFTYYFLIETPMGQADEDRAAEDAIIHELAAQFPEIAFLRLAPPISTLLQLQPYSIVPTLLSSPRE
jgi:N-acyl amino acid synthase of PEP-CTERM/exosortase system